MKTNTVITSVLVAASLLLSAMPSNKALAANKHKFEKAAAKSTLQPIKIEYLGENEGYAYVRFSFSQATAQEGTVQILDKDGYKLHEETVTTKDFSRTIKVSPEEFEKLTVSYTSNEKESIKSFTVAFASSQGYEIGVAAE